MLVGHDVRFDMKIIEDCFAGIWEKTVVSAVIDLPGLVGALKLGTILDWLDIGKEEYRGLHCGGNVANYTLKALLLTAIQHVDANIERKPVNEQRIQLIERAVRSCVPRLPKDTPQFERKRKQWDNVKNVGESLDDSGIGWSELTFNPSL